MRGKDQFIDSVAENLLDRLEDCERKFPTALCLGGSSEAIRRLLWGRASVACKFSPLTIPCWISFILVRDAGNLLTRAGFSLPGVDVNEYTVRYNSALELIEHLRSMGETNALLQRSNILKRDTALATVAIYNWMFSTENGTVPATFQVLHHVISTSTLVLSQASTSISSGKKFYHKSLSPLTQEHAYCL